MYACNECEYENGHGHGILMGIKNSHGQPRKDHSKPLGFGQYFECSTIGRRLTLHSCDQLERVANPANPSVRTHSVIWHTHTHARTHG